MSLIGRETDRVTHVLVNEPFDQCPDFFYPDQPVAQLKASVARQEVPVKAASARIALADVPFVPLRNGFVDLGEPRRSFAGLVDRYSRAIQNLASPPVAKLDGEKGVLELNGRLVELAGRNLELACFLYERARRGLSHFPNRSEAALAWDEWVENWVARSPVQAKKSQRTGRVTEQDVTNASNELRERLKDRGLENLIPFLAPKKGRIGFDLAPQ